MADDYDIGKAFEAIERELIASMIRNMERHKAEEKKEGFNWSMWQVEQLKTLEMYKKRNAKKYGKQFKSINAVIEQLIREAYDRGEMEQEIEILNAIKEGFSGYQKISDTMQAEFFSLNEEKLEALIKATTDDMKNAETAILRRANDQYRKIIFNAQVYANSGAGTYEQAVDMATKDMLAAGLNCVEYANGSRHSLKDYADMAIRTASKRAYLQGEGAQRRAWGIPTVIVNKRENPCPKCLPFCGKVMIDDVWSGGLKDGKSPVTGLKYPLMSKAVARGLYHPRCRDSHTTYFEGISSPPDNTYTKDELDQLAEKYKKEQQEKYVKRQAEKYERMAEFSLDPKNKRRYGARAAEWMMLVEQGIQKIKTLSKGLENSEKGATIKVVETSHQSPFLRINLQFFASLPKEKFTDYALNPLKSPDKAKAFKEALGYDQSNWNELMKNIKENLDESKFVEKGDNGHGMRYEYIMELTGANGKKANVLTAWIDDNGEKRLTSVYVTKKKVTE